MKKLSIIFTFFLLGKLLHAQTPNLVFANGLGSAGQEQCTSVTIDGSGNSYITGNFSGTTDFDPSVATTNLTAIGPTDIFVAKYNGTGQLQWAFSYGGASIYNTGTSIEYDGSGNIYVSGQFSDVVDFDPSASTFTLSGASGNAEAFLAKYNASGQFLWAISINGSGDEEINGIAFEQSGNILIGGKFSASADFDASASTYSLTSNGADDIFVCKYSSSGNFISAFNIGSAGFDYCNDICTDASGNYCITGAFDLTADFDPSPASFSLTAAGGSNATDIFTAKYSSSNNLLWAFNLGDVTNDEAASAVFDNTGNLFIGGFYSGTVDFDPSVTTTNSITAINNYDIFLAKYDSNGNLIWVNGLGGAGNEYISSLSLDGFNSVYATGSFNSTTDFDPSPLTQNLSSAGLQDVFVAKYDLNGNHIWSFASGGTGADVGFDIKVSLTGTEIYCGGLFQGTVDFDPTASTSNLICAGIEDAFINHYNDMTVGLKENKSTTVKTFPNPFTNEIKIFLEEKSVIEIYSASGQKVQTKNLEAGESTLNTNELAEGFYFLKLKNRNGEVCKKLLKTSVKN